MSLKYKTKQKQTKKVILFRCDGGKGIGIGHIMRCLALAQAWRQAGARVFFVSSQRPCPLKLKVEREGIKVRMIPEVAGSMADARRTIALAHSIGARVVILDGYRLRASYQRAIQGAHFLVVINDYGFQKPYVADVILDYNLGASKKDYPHRKAWPILLLGARYALLRKEFLKWRGWRRKIREVEPFRILITLGGSSQPETVKKVIEAIKRLPFKKLEIRFLLGGDVVANKKIFSAAASLPYLFAFQQNVKSVAQSMAWADMAISGGGVTSWELACMGLPSLLLICAENQRRGVVELERRKVSKSLGSSGAVRPQDIAQAIARFLRNPQMRREMSKRGKHFLDGMGAQRVVKSLTRLAGAHRREVLRAC